MTKLEHINITVPDIDKAITFIQIIAPDFIVRQDARPKDSYRWAHVGNDGFYIALQEPHLDSKPKNPRESYVNYGVNHIAFIVKDLSEIEKNLIAGGYTRGIDTSTRIMH